MKKLLLVSVLTLCFSMSAVAAQVDASRFVKDLSITTAKIGADQVTAAKLGTGAATLGQVFRADGNGGGNYGTIAGTSWSHTTPSLSAGDITAQFKDFPVLCVSGSEEVAITGVMGLLTADYTLSTVGGATRVTFVATTGFGTGSPQALVSGDVLDMKCAF